MEATRYANPSNGQINAGECAREFMPRVSQIARSLARRLPHSIDTDDLLQAGMLGLVQAARRYHGLRERFWRFACPRVRGAMIDALRAGDPAPRRLRRSARSLAKRVCRLEQVLGRRPCAREIAAEMQLTLDDYHRLLLEIDVHVPVMVESVEEIDSLCREGSDEDPLLPLLTRCAERRLLAAMSALPERERTMLELRLEDRLLQDIAAFFWHITVARMSAARRDRRGAAGASRAVPMRLWGNLLAEDVELPALAERNFVAASTTGRFLLPGKS